MAINEQVIVQAVDKGFDYVFKYIEKHPDQIAAAGLGAFLASKAGRALISQVVTKVVPALAKASVKLTGQAAKFTATQLAQYVNSLLVKYNVKADPKVVQNLTHGYGPDVLEKANETVEKLGKAEAVAGAAAISGFMVGSYLGNTISAFKGYKNAGPLEKITRVIAAPIYTVTDFAEQFKPESKSSKPKADEVANNVTRAIQTVTKSTANARAMARTDEMAEELGMMKRPTNPTAQTEWAKEVERMAEIKGKKTNNPAWYKEGKFNGIRCSGTYNYDTKNGNEETSPLPAFASGTNISKTGLPSVATVQVILAAGKAYNDMVENEFTDITIKLKALNKNSSLTTSWNKSDLFALIHNMRVAYAAWCVGRRAYKLVNEFSSTDLTLPYAYFAAMGLDYASWQSARAQIQEDLITMASRMSVFIDFGKLNVFKRTAQLFEYGYTDGNGLKAQQILFSVNKKTQFFDFNNSMAGTAANVNGDPVTDISSTSTGMDYLTWKTNFLAILNSMLDNSKVNDMMSCLRYALGTTKEPLFKVPAPGEKLSFIYDTEVLAQIENCTLVGKTSDITYSIAISGNWISETFTRSNAITKKVINTHMSEVPKDDEIVLSRLQAAKLTPPGSTTPEWYWSTEIAVVFVVITTYATSTNVRKLEYWQYYDRMNMPMYVTANSDAQKVVATEQLVKIGLLTAFDWAPIVPMEFTMGSTSSTAVSLTVNGIVAADWENYAIAYDTSVDASLVWMSYLRNGNYSLYSNLQVLLDSVLDKARTA